MSDAAEVFISPSEALFYSCTKVQLFRIAEHFKIVIEDKRVKEGIIRETLRTKIREQSILVEMAAVAGQVKPPVSTFTFEQQERLLSLELEQGRLKRNRA